VQREQKDQLVCAKVKDAYIVKDYGGKAESRIKSEGRKKP